MSRPSGQLERSLAALTIGIYRAGEDRKRALADGGQGEIEQQVHVPFSGGATVDWGYADATVMWEFPFVYAPLQRRVPFTTPHFLANFELTQGSGSLVIFHAHVVSWTISPEGWYTGAIVRLAASAPLDITPVAYAAIAHLTFQGYATYAEGNEFG